MAYRSGDLIPKCSSYTVVHHEHEGASVVIGAAGDTFPRCKKCGDAVSYEAIGTDGTDDQTTAVILAGHPEFLFPILRG